MPLCMVPNPSQGGASWCCPLQSTGSALVHNSRTYRCTKSARSVSSARRIFRLGAFLAHLRALASIDFSMRDMHGMEHLLAAVRHTSFAAFFALDSTLLLGSLAGAPGGVFSSVSGAAHRFWCVPAARACSLRSVSDTFPSLPAGEWGSPLLRCLTWRASCTPASRSTPWRSHTSAASGASGSLSPGPRRLGCGRGGNQMPGRPTPPPRPPTPAPPQGWAVARREGALETLPAPPQRARLGAWCGRRRRRPKHPTAKTALPGDLPTQRPTPPHSCAALGLLCKANRQPCACASSR